MYDKNLRYKVKKLLEKRTSNGLKIKDIAALIRVGKHKRKDLKDTLFTMVREKEIEYANHKYHIADIVDNIMSGTFDARSLAKNRSYAFVRTEKEDFFVSSEDTLNAYDGDIVEIQIKYGARKRKYGIITRIVERNRQEFVGTLQFYGKKAYLVPDNSRIHTNFLINNTGNAANNDKVVLKITNWGNKDYSALPGGIVTEVLGPSGDPDVEILSVIKHYGLPLEFPEEVISESLMIPEVDYEKEAVKRFDYRGLATITIDPVSAKDFDDAISLEINDTGYLLYVHIADVAHFVRKDSALFKEALNRGNSYYFPKKVLPMLPEGISNKRCSLRPQEEKLTMTVATQYDQKMNIVHQQVQESVIKSDIRLNYEEVDALFESRENEIPVDISELLFKMKKLSSTLSKQRYKKGYLRFELPETEFVFDDSGRIIDLRRSRETDSHSLIENFMLVANEFIAKQLSSAATIYRIHERPDDVKIEDIRDLLAKYGHNIPAGNNPNALFQNMLQQLENAEEHRVFDRLILRSLKRARYAIENFGHFGLAIEYYTHFTSPIRRISDLLVHHQIKDKLNSRDQQFNRNELFEYAGIATDRERIADDSEREVEYKNKLNFMKTHLGEEFSGIIVSIRSTAIIVELDKYPVTGLIELTSLKDDYYEFLDEYKQLIGKRKGRIFKMTDKVNVMISKVADDVYLQMVE